MNASVPVVEESDPASGARPGSGWRNPWLFGWIGLVVTVLAVNATMVVLAFATNPGLVSDDYYERGRDVERTIVSRRESTPDWTIAIDTPADLRVGETSRIGFVVVDRAGQPVNPESVRYFAYRPSDADLDFSLPMAMEGPGRFAATVEFPNPGVWDTLIAVETDSGEFAFDQRIRVAGP